MKLVGSTVWRYRNPCPQTASPSLFSGSGRKERWTLSETLHLLCEISCAGGRLLKASSGKLGPDLWTGAGLLGMGTCRTIWMLRCIQTFAALGTQKCYTFNERAYKETKVLSSFGITPLENYDLSSMIFSSTFFYPFFKAILISCFYYICEKNLRKENLHRKCMLCVRNNSRNWSPHSVPF